MKDVIDEPKAFKLDRDNSSGHVAHFVPPQYGPPADNLNENTSDKEFYKDCLVSMEHLVIEAEIFMTQMSFKFILLIEIDLVKYNRYVDANMGWSLWKPTD